MSLFDLFQEKTRSHLSFFLWWGWGDLFLSLSSWHYSASISGISDALAGFMPQSADLSVFCTGACRVLLGSDRILSSDN
jgi:hypothetical protein